MVEHLMRVASGLDSLVLGEPQILGQIKQSYQLSREAGVLGKTLNRLFQHVFKAAKQIRTETAISSNPVSVAFAAVSLSKQIFTHLADQSVLLIGAGEMVALCARHMRENGVSQVTIANRTLHRAAALAHEFQAQAVVLEDIPDVLENIDIIISSTASPLPLLGKGLIERALKKRKNRPMFMVDLAIPRDIEPEVGTLNGVYLYTLDDLGSVVEENKRSREAAAEEAQELVDLQVREFVSWVQSMDAFSAIQLYRQQAESLRDEVLKRVVKPHQKDGYSEEDLRALAYQLTNKLIHMPSVCLRNAGAEGDAEQLHLAQKLLLPTVAE